MKIFATWLRKTFKTWWKSLASIRSRTAGSYSVLVTPRSLLESCIGFRIVIVPMMSCDHNNFNEQALAEVQSHALICKSDIDLVDTNIKVSDHGKFKDERKWPEWEKAFINYLSVIPGMNRVSLSYIVRDAAEPEDGVEYHSMSV
jgi:hypothetical protein